MVVHAFNQSTLESEAGESLELEVSQSYIVKACLKIMQFFTETEKKTLKYENTKRFKLAQRLLNYENTTRGITIPDFEYITEL